MLNAEKFAGLAASDRRAESRDRATEAAWKASLDGAPAQLAGIARDLASYKQDGARVVPTWDADGDDMDVRAQVAWLIDSHEEMRAQMARETRREAA